MLAQAIAFPERMSGTQCASTENLAPSMGATNPTAVAFNMHKSGNEASSLGISEDRTDCLRAFEKAPFAVQPQQGMMVRRLTPMECERLQGFPDDYTNVPHRNKPAADGPRYKALGNSWAVPNVRWIGERIQAVDAIRLEIAA
jgi:DNA (cytosine-5)-methyltransferase 1